MPFPAWGSRSRGTHLILPTSANGRLLADSRRTFRQGSGGDSTCISLEVLPMKVPVLIYEGFAEFEMTLLGFIARQEKSVISTVARATPPGDRRRRADSPG